MTHKEPKKIVILGAGFAGLATYLQLHKLFHDTDAIEVTMVNDSDQFVFVPMIHEVATGTLTPASITRPLRSLPWCCMYDFIHGKAMSVDLDRRRVRVEYHQKSATSLPDGDAHHHHVDVAYDYLVLAMGSETNFFGVDGAQENTLPLKTLNDARLIKNHIIERFEEASRERVIDKIKDMLRFVVVGGGATGVELAGELSDLISVELARTFPHLKGLASIIIVEGSDRLLSRADAWFSQRIFDKLEAAPYINFIFNSRVTKVTDRGVYLGDDFVRSDTVVWSGGVRARDIAIVSEQELGYEERSLRIKVSETLNLPSYSNVFVIGDQAWVFDKETEQPYPMRAQFASREGVVAANNIAHHIHDDALEVFEWDEQGFIISLGRWGAFAEVFGMKLSGWPAWVLYKVVYITKTIGWRSKLRMGLEWILNAFLSRDVSKL